MERCHARTTPSAGVVSRTTNPSKDVPTTESPPAEPRLHLHYTAESAGSHRGARGTLVLLNGNEHPDTLSCHELSEAGDTFQSAGSDESPYPFCTEPRDGEPAHRTLCGFRGVSGQEPAAMLLRDSRRARNAIGTRSGRNPGDWSQQSHREWPLNLRILESLGETTSKAWPSAAGTPGLIEEFTGEIDRCDAPLATRHATASSHSRGRTRTFLPDAVVRFPHIDVRGTRELRIEMVTSPGNTPVVRRRLDSWIPPHGCVVSPPWKPAGTPRKDSPPEQFAVARRALAVAALSESAEPIVAARLAESSPPAAAAPSARPDKRLPRSEW